MKRRRDKFITIVLVITVAIFGFIFGMLVSESKVQAENKINLEETSVSAKHGYGVYLQFEYEIIDSSYGSFVVIKPRNGGQTDFHVAGIKP